MKPEIWAMRTCPPASRNSAALRPPVRLSEVTADRPDPGMARLNNTTGMPAAAHVSDNSPDRLIDAVMIPST